MDIEKMLAAYRLAHESMTEDELAHEHHAQRVNFAVGNVAISNDAGPGSEQYRRIERAARRIAGRCPCNPCRNLQEWRGRVVTRGDATRWDVRTGDVYAGEIEACVSKDALVDMLIAAVRGTTDHNEED